MHKKTKGNLLITLGILLIAAAVGLAGYNLWDASRAQKAAEEITGQLISDIESKVEDGKTAAPYIDPNTPMPVEVVDGYEYIGVLEIPSEGLSLPVMKEWDYTRLKISPCRFTEASGTAPADRDRGGHLFYQCGWADNPLYRDQSRDRGAHSRRADDREFVKQ